MLGIAWSNTEARGILYSTVPLWNFTFHMKVCIKVRIKVCIKVRMKVCIKVNMKVCIKVGMEVCIKVYYER